MPEMMLGSGIRYTEIHDPKFRSCLLNILFYVHRSRQTAPIHALLPDLLTASSAAYPSAAEMTLALESLYAAEFCGKLSLCGDDAALDLTASWMRDDLALSGESVTDAMLSLVTDALLHPNAADNGFRDPEFRICKQNLLDDIDCTRNDKRIYTLRSASALAYIGEPAAIPPTGLRSDAEAVTPEDAFRLWQEILRTSQIEIVCVLPKPNPQIAEKLRECFAALPRTPETFCFHAPSPMKQQPAFEKELLPVGQTKLAVTYKYDNIPREVLLMLCSILGWNSDALLFTELREKRGLCYYCCLEWSSGKHSVIIDSGTDSADLNALRIGIDAQIEAIRNGRFSDKMMQKAILRYACRAAAASDSPYDLAAEEISRLQHDDPRSAAELTAAMQTVTREQIADAAKQLRLDSVFVLLAEREEAAFDAE
ncbi:MAG: insulinase family protein [Oscillospiraceae bacterium]|nr:insulinase family protein [Oscillospiraceae bacterium]